MTRSRAISVLMSTELQLAARMKNPFRLSLSKPRALSEFEASLIALSDACAKSSVDCTTASVFAAFEVGPVAPRQAPSRSNRTASAQRTADAAGACPFGAVTCGDAGSGSPVSGSGGDGAGGLSLSHDTVANAARINATIARTERFMS